MCHKCLVKALSCRCMESSVTDAGHCFLKPLKPWSLEHKHTHTLWALDLIRRGNIPPEKKTQPHHRHSERKCVLLLRNSLPPVLAGGLLVNIIMSPSIGEDDTFFFSANIYHRPHSLSGGAGKLFHWLEELEVLGRLSARQRQVACFNVYVSERYFSWKTSSLLYKHHH